jgi:pimeloyl-ACP methyl ester carboxylesterase
MLSSFALSSRLFYWLGPWAEKRDLAHVRTHWITLAGDSAYPRELEMLRCEPRGKALGTVLVLHGLHPLGPRDHRLERFCRKLAAAGLSVWTPALPEYLSLSLKESVIAAAKRAARAVEADRFAAFSISFGSLPALRLVASDAASPIGGLVVFGGYADFNETMRFALGADGRPRDPLSPPAIFINLVDFMDGAPAETSRLVHAWHQFALQTWGKPEMKMKEAYTAVAERFAATLPSEDERELFLIGCALRPGGLEKCERALKRIVEQRGFLDARPFLSQVRCPVTIVHGASDDVIPFSQAESIAAALPPALDVRSYITGLYGHTGAAARPGIFDLLKEAKKLAGMSASLASFSASAFGKRASGAVRASADRESHKFAPH